MGNWLAIGGNVKKPIFAPETPTTFLYERRSAAAAMH